MKTSCWLERGHPKIIGQEKFDKVNANKNTIKIEISPHVDGLLLLFVSGR